MVCVAVHIDYEVCGSCAIMYMRPLRCVVAVHKIYAVCIGVHINYEVCGSCAIMYTRPLRCVVAVH